MKNIDFYIQNFLLVFQMILIEIVKNHYAYQNGIRKLYIGIFYKKLFF